MSEKLSKRYQFWLQMIDDKPIIDSLNYHLQQGGTIKGWIRLIYFNSSSTPDPSHKSLVIDAEPAQIAENASDLDDIDFSDIEV